MNILKTIEAIPFFSEDRYWGKAPKEELERALALIDTAGWDAFKKTYEGRFDFTFDENRADWRFSLPITKETVVLDAGAGMGRNAIPLARVAGKVVALDQSFLRMKFLKKRAVQEGLGNIDTYVGDLFDASFPEGSFDLIVMNGLLEWIGATDRFADPREAQLAALRLCKRLLRKGGYLYVGIENRFAAAYLRGAIDHSGIRFTSFMPRFVADMYMRLRGRGRYNTYTYGARGYRTLLLEAGFSDPHFYLVYPGYNRPRITVPYEELGLLSCLIRTLMPGRSLRQRCAQAMAHSRFLLRIYRAVFFSFNIIVRA